MTFDPITRKLTPDDGLWLTNKEVADESTRVISDLMFLGINDAPTNYIEWTDAQVEQWHKDHPDPQPDE